MGTVLIVEDDVDIRESLQNLLSMEGIRVHAVSNGIEALEALARITPPNLILLDLMMPVMDGWKFRAQQKANPKIAHIPVAVLTAAGTLRQKTGHLDGVEYLDKPVEANELLTLVKKYCA